MKTLEQIESELKAMNLESEEELHGFIIHSYNLPKDYWEKLKGNSSKYKAKILWNKWQKEKKTPTIEEVKEKYKDAKVRFIKPEKFFNEGQEVVIKHITEITGDFYFFFDDLKIDGNTIYYSLDSVEIVEYKEEEHQTRKYTSEQMIDFANWNNGCYANDDSLKEWIDLADIETITPQEAEEMLKELGKNVKIK